MASEVYKTLKVNTAFLQVVEAIFREQGEVKLADACAQQIGTNRVALAASSVATR